MPTQFFGQFLLSQRAVTRGQLLDAVEYQERHNLRLGDYAVKKAFITPADAARIHASQTTRDVQFGEAAVELGLLTQTQLGELLRAQRADHLYLGDVLAKLGFMSAEAVQKALGQYREEQKGQEGDTLYLPSDTPNLPLVAEACELTHKMLSRLWGTPTKYGSVRSGERIFRLPGTVVAVSITGDVSAKYFLGIPDELTNNAIRRLFGSTDTPSRDDRIDIVSELANVVVGNLVSTLANLGRQVDLTPPRLSHNEVRLELEQASVMPLIAPLNDVAMAVAQPTDNVPRSAIVR
jgi:CheY-specific phosphatase CheX